MPQIQEYLPQQESQGPVGGTSPNIELAGAVGRSIENVGGAIGGAFGEYHNALKQQESADVYADMSEKKADFAAQIQQQTQDGTLDVDKVMEQYDDAAGKVGDNVSTPEASRYLERLQARNRGSLLHQAMVGKAQIAANDSKGKLKMAMDANGSYLMNNPADFEDVYNGGLEHIDQLIKTEGLPEKYRETAVRELGGQYAKAALRGWMQLGPDGPDNAKKLLDSGSLDKFLSGDQKHQMYMEVDRTNRANEVEDRRAQKAVEDAKKLTEQQWDQAALPQLVHGTLTTKSILGAVADGKISEKRGEHWLNMVDVASRKDAKTDQRVMTQLSQRILDPTSANPINDVSELFPYVGHGISPQNLNTLNSMFDKTPDGQAMKQGTKTLMNAARATIRFKNLTNQYDIRGEQNLNQFTQDFLHAKQEIVKQGGRPADLVDPKSPLYFGKKLENYQTPYQEQLGHVSQERTDKALKPPTADDTEAKATNENVRRPNEDPIANMNRTGFFKKLMDRHKAGAGG